MDSVNSITVSVLSVEAGAGESIPNGPYVGEWAGGPSHGISSRACFDDSSYADEFNGGVKHGLCGYNFRLLELKGCKQNGHSCPCCCNPSSAE